MTQLRLLMRHAGDIDPLTGYSKPDYSTEIYTDTGEVAHFEDAINVVGRRSRYGVELIIEGPPRVETVPIGRLRSMLAIALQCLEMAGAQDVLTVEAVRHLKSMETLLPSSMPIPSSTLVEFMDRSPEFRELVTRYIREEAERLLTDPARVTRMVEDYLTDRRR